MTSFTYNGTDLSTLGKVTKVNYLDTPQRRGSNQTIPFQHGTAFSAKYYDERHITLGLVIQGTTAQDLEETLDTIKALVSPRAEKVLQMTMENGDVRTANASVDATFQTERNSALIARVVLDFTLSRPFWRGDATVNESVTVNTSPKTLLVTNTGTLEERNPVITLTGPLQNTVLSNANGVSMTYTGTISGGDVVVITTNSWGEYTATENGITNVIGNLSHNGSAAYMVLDVGLNTITITDSTATTGEVQIEFDPPYL